MPIEFRIGQKILAALLLWTPAAGGLPPSQETPAPAPAPRRTAAAASQPSAAAAAAGVAQVQNLLESLARYDRDGRNPERKVGFELPEQAINDYLAWSLRQKARPAIAATTLSLAGPSEVAAQVEVDFDAVRGWNAELIPESLGALLRGRQTVRAAFHFEAKNGQLTFTLKDPKAPENKSIPSKVASALLDAIGMRQPEEYDIAKPIPLPFGLKRIWIEKHSLYGET
jgi:hypothetical protein